MDKKEYIDISKYYPLAVTLLVATAIVMAFCFGVAVSSTEKVKMIRPFVQSEFPKWRISGKYKDLRADGGSGERIHWGVDYVIPSGTTIIAPYDGTITVSKFMGNYGNVIFIDHGNGVQSRIAHLSEFKKLAGAVVKQGEIIGHSGDTGNAKGKPHAHFETLINGIHFHPATFVF